MTNNITQKNEKYRNTFYKLAAAFFVLQAIDVVSTLYGLTLGLSETNEIIVFIARFMPMALAVTLNKLVLCYLFYRFYRLLVKLGKADYWGLTISCAMMCIFYFAVAVNNLALIAIN